LNYGQELLEAALGAVKLPRHYLPQGFFGILVILLACFGVLQRGDFLTAELDSAENPLDLDHFLECVHTRKFLRFYPVAPPHLCQLLLYLIGHGHTRVFVDADAMLLRV
jgi:hypothetical protein